ncbi:hypothetical protein GJR96_16645 [Haloferax sp. MBLA0076]|uniref:Uncharacterized protein n=1 Tax=Haloferax litoreum TaxID=2666140 RepID=A0A6A8GJJ9_9EURY|nr:MULTISPECIES: hypothetical protein [Haloferax]KAB1190585.1 hypothetical protein Hfx1148_16590 [Haloferax sp. CBA1148]MRX23574.1 hypothetical protein [Haloferax litoreum]
MATTNFTSEVESIAEDVSVYGLQQGTNDKQDDRQTDSNEAKNWLAVSRGGVCFTSRSDASYQSLANCSYRMSLVTRRGGE